MLCDSAAMAAPWSVAWRDAATGPGGFWRREEPTAHFTTSTGRVLAAAMAGVLAEVDARLGSPSRIDVVDMGAGDGALLTAMAEVLGDGDLGSRARFIGIDVRARPGDLLSSIQWRIVEHDRDGLIATPDHSVGPLRVRGLLMAHEWLDEVPLDIVQRDASGVDRLVLVERDGRESLGDAVEGTDEAEWLARWWPLCDPGDRAEVGRSRDIEWARLCSAVEAGTVIATDYGHVRSDRRPTIRAYLRGTVVDPVPDGSCNLTAHVALDACMSATPPDMAVSSETQRDALAAMELSGALPDPRGASPEAYARALEDSLQARALRDPKGRGSFTWLRADR